MSLITLSVFSMLSCVVPSTSLVSMEKDSEQSKQQPNMLVPAILWLCLREKYYRLFIIAGLSIIYLHSHQIINTLCFKTHLEVRLDIPTYTANNHILTLPKCLLNNLINYYECYIFSANCIRHSVRCVTLIILFMLTTAE